MEYGKGVGGSEKWAPVYVHLGWLNSQAGAERIMNEYAVVTSNGFNFRS